MVTNTVDLILSTIEELNQRLPLEQQLPVTSTMNVSKKSNLWITLTDN